VIRTLFGATLVTVSALHWVGCSSARARSAVARPGGVERLRRSFHSPSAAHGEGGVWRNWVDTVRLGDAMQLTPINTYHLRTTYSMEKIARYTEWPLGLGYGRSRIDEQGNRREVFGIVFQDSAARWQYNFGYMHLWNRSVFGANQDVVIGAGYMVFVMGRWDWNYFPIPVVLPVLSLGVSRFSIETTFVPGWEGLGQLFFTWIQMRL
jgi:palmitoyl transferase